MNLPLQQKLSACPFCGGGTTTIRENGRMWSARGMSEPSSISIMHWCEPIAGQPSRVIERVGRDLESAIAAWEMRSPASVEVTDAQIEQAAKFVHDTFASDLAQGYVTKDKQFAVNVLGNALRGAAPTSGTASDAAVRNAALAEAAKACGQLDCAHRCGVGDEISASILALKVEVPTHG